MSLFMRPSADPPLAVIFAAEDAASQRRPRGHADIQRFRYRDEFALDGSLDQAVFDLHRDERRPAAKLGERVGLRHPPGRSIGDSDVEHLALTHQVVERSHRFFGGRELIPDVHPVQIDVVGFQALQAGFDGLHHIFAVVAGRVWVRGRERRWSILWRAQCSRDGRS